MSGKDKLQARLVPARPATDADSSGFMPRIPWRLIALGASIAVVLFGLYALNQRRKVAALRQQVLRVHESVLAEPVRRYGDFRKLLEDLIVGAAAQPPDDYVDPRLRLSGLHAGKGLYLRLGAESATTRQRIATAARAFEPDSVPSCLGLGPLAARGIWEHGEFLLPAWRDEVRKQDNLMALRVTDTVLSNHIKLDLPAVTELLRSDWFLLVLDRGQSDAQALVDVWLWDLHSKQTLLRGRFHADGILLPVRVRSKDAPPSPVLSPQPRKSPVAEDCSIATQVKQLAAADIGPNKDATPASR
jgi:hypothetical protein